MKKLYFLGLLIVLLCVSFNTSPKKVITMEKVPLTSYFGDEEATKILDIEKAISYLIILKAIRYPSILL